MALETDRLIVRPPLEADRSRFVELFTDEAFTVFSGRHDVESANARFDHMLAMANLVPYAKQPLVDPGNVSSRRVADKVGFRWWKRVDWEGDPEAPTDVLVRPIGAGGPPARGSRAWRPAPDDRIPY